MGIIYIITNDITSKVYIGQTIQSLSHRWAQHKEASKTKNTHLYRAMRKYGVNHFSISVLEENVPEEYLNELECYYISFYDSFNNGYNSTYGGQGRWVGNQICSKEELQDLWNQGYGIKEISNILHFHDRTCSKWIQYYNIASQEEILNRAFEKQHQNHTSVKILFENKVYDSIKELASFLKETNPIFSKKKINTIIQGISDASKRNVTYCKYHFYRI